MERESFVFYRSFYEASKFLSNEDKGKLFDMVCQYGLYGNEIETDGPAMGMFLLIKPQLDANNRRYENGCKGGAPEGNSNAVKNWKNISKQPKNNQNTTKNQPNDNQKQPNVNVNVNENDNEKGSGEKREADNTLDANASRGIVGEKRVVGKTLSMKLGELGLEPELIELAETYDKCKKGKKLSKFQDEQLKIRVNKLRKCGFNTIEGMKELLENSIAGGYEGIFELKQNPVPTKPRVSGNLFH